MITTIIIMKIIKVVTTMTRKRKMILIKQKEETGNIQGQNGFLFAQTTLKKYKNIRKEKQQKQQNKP